MRNNDIEWNIVAVHSQVVHNDLLTMKMTSLLLTFWFVVLCHIFMITHWRVEFFEQRYSIEVKTIIVFGYLRVRSGSWCCIGIFCVYDPWRALGEKGLDDFELPVGFSTKVRDTWFLKISFPFRLTPLIACVVVKTFSKRVTQRRKSFRNVP